MTGPTEFSFPQAYRTDRRSAARWILSHALHQWPYLLLGFLGAIGNAATGAVVPIVIGRAVSAVRRGEADTARLALFGLVVAGSQVARMVVQFIRGASFEVIAQRVERNAREELYTCLLGKSMAFHSLQPVGEVMARATNDVRELNFFFSPGANWAVGSMVFLITPLWCAPQFHPQLVLTPALFLIGYVLVLRVYLKQLAPAAESVRTEFGRLNAQLSESLDGVEQVKGAAREQSEIRRLGRAAGRYRDATVRQGDVEARFLPMLLLALSLAVGLCHALLLLRAGRLDLGQVVGYFGTLMLLDFPTFAGMFAYSRMASGMAGAKRILQLMNTENPVDQNPGGHAGPMSGNIELRGVSFAYDTGGSPSLTDVSFQVAAGLRVAVVGQTGSGKTTLAKLINRTYDASSGQVLVDGHDVRDWSLDALRRSISIIEQDVFLFSKSIRENIAFGRPGVRPEDVVAAAEAAQAHEFIMGFADGYDTVIGDRGVTLSGGQRQRLALARAFLTNPRILILDDSTSSIDSATEDRIQQAIFAAASGRTTLIITHRLSQIRWADLVLVLRQGRLVVAGQHEALMQTCDAYKRIFSE